jgi:hypothetical protein
MTSDTNPKKIIQKINGVLIEIEEHRVKATFLISLNLNAWQQLMKLMDELLNRGYDQWEFNLERMIGASSIDLGMWPTCNAKITKSSGTLVFAVGENAVIQGVLRLTRLNEILDIK